MGEPHREWKRYRIAVQKGDFEMAMSIAKTYELILDLRDSLDLTILAGRKRKPMFDPMSVRWIWLLHEQNRRKSKLSLAEVEHLAATFRRLWRGDPASEDELWRFLATGKTLGTRQP